MLAALWPQYELITMLAGPTAGYSTSLFTVGDPNQAIYGFRWALTALDPADGNGCHLPGAGSRPCSAPPSQPSLLAPSTRRQAQVMEVAQPLGALCALPCHSGLSPLLAEALTATTSTLRWSATSQAW